MSLCLSEAAANTRGRLCLRPSISGRCACTVPLPSQHARAVPAPWPHGWGRPLAVAAPTTPRPHCDRTFWQRPSYRGRCRRHACAAPRPRYPLMLPKRHLTESAAPTTPRPRNALTVWLKPPIWQRPPPARLGRATPALCPHGLRCVAATAARTRAEHTAEYRAAAAVGGFPVHTM